MTIRERNDSRFLYALYVLEYGVDAFAEFEEGDLRAVWEMHGEGLCEMHTGQDPTTMPAGWWWFTAPANLRLEYPVRVYPTDQRKRLLAAGMLYDAATARLAQDRVEQWRESEQPVNVFDLRKQQPRILL